MAAGLSISRLAILLARLLWIAPARAEEIVVCPQAIPDGASTRALSGADVYQGVLDNRAVVRPGPQASAWRLGQHQKKAARRGESLYLVCHYDGLEADVQLRIARSATVCAVEQSGRGLFASCGGALYASERRLANRRSGAGRLADKPR